MLQVVLHDGRPFAIHVVTPKGDPRNPLSFDEVAEKMRDLARKALPARTVEKIIETVRGLEKLGNAAQLARLCTRH
jgi:2-methylcitrate dehydratase PrpD